MIRDYNYHNWSSFMVKTFDKRPMKPHYAVLVFGTRSEYTPGWDQNDPGSSSSVPELTYFAFEKKDELEMWVGEASKANMKFVFFRVEKIGEVEIKVSVNTDV